MSLPDVVTRNEWAVARKEPLREEKEHTRHRDALKAERRRLSMVEVDEAYVFTGPEGKVGLLDLFEGRRQPTGTSYFLRDASAPSTPTRLTPAGPR